MNLRDCENALLVVPGFSKIRKMADDIAIAISGLCSFLFWPYPLTSNDPTERARWSWRD